jgi:hypothetical protein
LLASRGSSVPRLLKPPASHSKRLEFSSARPLSCLFDFCEYSYDQVFVGNLPSATDDAVRECSRHGTVEKIADRDRDTGRPRGFGFVEMNQADASRHPEPQRH